MELRGLVKSFPYGKAGEESVVGKLHWNTKSPNKLKEHSETKYAELWIGIHPKGECIIRESRQKLSTYIKNDPETLGISRYQFKDEFPFLMKILSIEKPLTVQLHLNEYQATKLHKGFPDLVPDTKHNSKLVVPLSNFEVMVGFTAKTNIIYYLQNVPELTTLIKPNLIKDFVNTKKSFYLRRVVGDFLNTPRDKITEAINNYFHRMDIADSATRNKQLFEDISKFQDLQPYDIGVFFPFFLNYFVLEKDEAIYIPSNIPYTYINGDAIECSTCTKNEPIKIGLTSEPIDIVAFIEYGDFTSYDPNELKVKPVFGPYTTIFDCDEDEYILYKIRVYKDNYYTIHGKRTFCIFIVMEGNGINQQLQKLKIGTIMFILPSETYHLKAIEEMVLYMVEPNLVI